MSSHNPSLVDEVMHNASCAAAVFGELSQEHTDRIVRAVYEAAFASRVRLAKLAHEETGKGKWKDKVIKNVLASQLVYEDIKNLQTVGVISESPDGGITEIAQPIGPIFAMIPVTNPTSTVIFKILISLKTRNPIIIAPHPSAVKSSCEAARICYEAALSEDAPEQCVQWLTEVSRDQTRAFMTHKDLSLVLATGGSSLVHAAYSSGTPAIGVGPGNVPAYIEGSADVPFAVEQIIMSKTFDNGTVCASEQAIVVEEAQAQELRDELIRHKCHILSVAEVSQVEKAVFDKERGIMAADIVGMSAAFVAKKAGIEIPDDTELLIAPLTKIGNDEPLSGEILAPVLALYVAKDFDSAVNTCIELNFHGGIGHTASIYSNDDAKILEFANVINAGRIVVNTPSSQGAVGGLFNSLHPSLTLGCGSGGKNITTDNITAHHLLNIQRIARRRPNRKFERFDKNEYFDESKGALEIEKLYNRDW